MKVRKISMSTKVLLIVAILFLASDITLGVFLYQKSYEVTLSQVRENAGHIASCAADIVDGRLLDEIHTHDDIGNDAFNTIYDQLTTFYEYGGVEYCYIVRKDPNGFNFVIDSDPENPGLPGDSFDTDAEDLNKAMTGVLSVNEKPYTDEWGGHISAYCPIFVDGQIVGIATVDTSTELIDDMVGAILTDTIIICVIVFVIGAAILFLLSRSLKKGFVTLNNKVVELTSGDGDLTKKIEITSGDEFEVIGNNINELLSFIRGILVSISQNSRLLSTSSAAIAENLDEAQNSAANVSTTMDDMSRTVQNTSDSLNEINDLVNNITEAFDGVVKQIEEGRQFSSGIRSQAIDIGSKASSDKESAEDKVEEMSRLVQEKIDQSKSVEQIDVLTENILSITEQTNLLSLNASIEAARAGEAGKGFAVVASEIGSLATDSAEAASQIQKVSAEVIAAVNALADEAREMIEFIKGPAIKGYADLVDTSDNYKDSAERFDSMMTEISELTSNIKTDIATIQNSTDQVSRALVDAADGVNRVAEQSRDMTNNMKSIDSDANSGRDVSNALSDAVGKFKLE